MISELRKAAISLNDSLSKWNWFRMVGVGKEELIVYVSVANKTVPNSWCGFSVQTIVMSDPKIGGIK